MKRSAQGLQNHVEERNVCIVLKVIRIQLAHLTTKMDAQKLRFVVNLQKKHIIQFAKRCNFVYLEVHTFSLPFFSMMFLACPYEVTIILSRSIFFLFFHRQKSYAKKK